jgi:hypothetical protein
MSTDYKQCTTLYKNSVVIIIPSKKDSLIQSILLTCYVDLEHSLKYCDLDEEMKQKLKEQVQYLFNVKGCYSISLIQSENCKDIIELF